MNDIVLKRVEETLQNILASPPSALDKLTYEVSQEFLLDIRDSLKFLKK